jgi:hypothetical protein
MPDYFSYYSDKFTNVVFGPELCPKVEDENFSENFSVKKEFCNIDTRYYGSMSTFKMSASKMSTPPDHLTASLRNYVD